MNIMIIIFSLFNVINNFITEKIVNFSCLCEEIEEDKQEYELYDITNREGYFEVFYNDESIHNLISEKTKYFVNKDELVIFYKTNEDDLCVLVFRKGKITINNTINSFVGEFDVIKDGTKYVIVGGINKIDNELIEEVYKDKEYLENEDAIIILYDINSGIIKCNVYGGELSDAFEKVYKQDSCYFVIGKKITNSGYDFGYGGGEDFGYLLCKLNENLELLDYKIFEEEIINLEIDDFINVFCINVLYCFDNELNLKNNLEFDLDCIFGLKIDKYLVGVFGQTGLNLYDLNKSVNIDFCEYPFKENIDEVSINEEYVFLKNRKSIYKANFYDNYYQNFNFVYDHGDLNNVNEIIGIPHNFRIQNIIYDEKYDKGSHGKYDVFLDFGHLIIKSSMEVLKRVNVNDGGVYPVGYNMIFSGKGYLNQQEILNNYLLVEEGQYEFLLVGKDEEEKIEFEVKRMNIEYEEEDLKDWDYEINKNQKLCLDIKCNIVENGFIKKVIINGGEKEFKYNPDTKILNFDVMEEEVGKYYYNLDEIIYEVDGVEYSQKYDYRICVKVLEDKLNFDNEVRNDEKYIYFDSYILNNNNNLRFIKAVIGEEKEEIYLLAIKDGDLILDCINVQDDLISIYLVYDIGSKLYEEQLLFQLIYHTDGSRIGEIKIKENDGEVNRIIFKMDNKEALRQLIIENEVVYEYKNVDYINPIIIVVVSFIIVGIFIKRFKRKRK